MRIPSGRSSDGLIAVSIYLSPEEYVLVKKLAEQELRSMSSLAKWCLIRKVREKGIVLNEEEELLVEGVEG